MRQLHRTSPELSMRTNKILAERTPKTRFVRVPETLGFAHNQEVFQRLAFLALADKEWHLHSADLLGSVVHHTQPQYVIAGRERKLLVQLQSALQRGDVVRFGHDR